METMSLTPEEFKEVVNAFRTLRRWRDERMQNDLDGDETALQPLMVVAAEG